MSKMFETGISVACQVTTGTFMSEFFVKVQHEGEILWQGAVDKEIVIGLKDTPAQDKFVDGRIYAYLISSDGPNAIIELPVESSLSGRRFSVPLKLLRREKVPA